MTSTTTQAAQGIGSSNKVQIGQALSVKNYCNSIIEQPVVNFSGIPSLLPYQTEINNALAVAQGHATDYLSNIYTAMVENMTSIDAYYNLHNAIATTLPVGSTKTEWLSGISTMQTQAAIYQANASQLAGMLNTLGINLATDSASFSAIVTDLNNAVKGDNGVLDTLATELDAVSDTIDEEIAAVVGSGIAIVGGAIMVAVGALAELPTAGASTALVAGGAVLAIGGIAGTVASAVALNSAMEKQGNLITEEQNLESEVTLAAGISSGYKTLNSNTATAVTNANQMTSAWDSLSDDLGALATDLTNGLTTVAQTRQAWFTAANTEIQVVQTDLATIKIQLAGLQDIVPAPGQMVGAALLAAAKAAA